MFLCARRRHHSRNIEVVKEERTGEEHPFVMPERCPECGAEIVREDGEAAYRCVGTNCPAQLVRNIIHFASKGAMDIDGLGPAIIEQMIDRSMIASPADLYFLKKEEVAEMEKMGEKSAQNLLDALERSKQNDLSRLLFAFGIRLNGQRSSKLLAKQFRSLDAIMELEVEQMAAVHEIGEKTAQYVYDFSVIRNRYTYSGKVEVCWGKYPVSGEGR